MPFPVQSLLKPPTCSACARAIMPRAAADSTNSSAARLLRILIRYLLTEGAVRLTPGTKQGDGKFAEETGGPQPAALVLDHSPGEHAAPGAALLRQDERRVAPVRRGRFGIEPVEAGDEPRHGDQRAVPAVDPQVGHDLVGALALDRHRHIVAAAEEIVVRRTEGERSPRQEQLLAPVVP